MQRLIFGFMAAALVGGCASDGVGHTGAPAAVEPAPAETAARQFELLKSLEGTWVASGAEGSVEGAEIRYEVTAAGSAVLETVFPGADHEMVSVYHMDNGRLVMTHYCAMGNQPFFTSEAGTAANVIKLTCTGAHNTASHADPHMHEGVFTVGDGTLHTEWTMFHDLQPGAPVVLDLVRADS